MNEDRLKALLQETPVPLGEEAERRGLRMVNEAFAQRQTSRPPMLPRLALAVAIGALLAAMLLSPAGAAVRDWIGDIFTAGVPDAEPALTEVPGGGRLLVQSQAGPWVVQPDGSRRLLGRYVEATWSPRGLFVGAVSGHTLSAIEPDGSPHWSLSAKAAVSDPRWSPSGFRIAYRAGHALWTVAGDGTGDALLDPRVRPVPPVWAPQGLALLAYVDADGGLRIVNTDTAEALGSTEALPGITGLGWAPGGSMLLETSRRSLRVRDVTAHKLLARLSIGPARQIPLSAGVTVRAAAFSPDGETIAALLGLAAGKGQPPRSEVVLIDAADGSLRRLFSVPGRLSGLAWSPQGNRLLISWRDADQWLFIPVGGRGRVRAIGGISEEFAPGKAADAAFPRIDGWCCATHSPAAG
jgi:hypothetical protein